MSTSTESQTLLSNEVLELMNHGSTNLEEAGHTLKMLLDRIRAAPHTKPIEESLQLLGTAVGKQSRRDKTQRESI